VFSDCDKHRDHVELYFASLRERFVSALMTEKDAGGPFHTFLQQ